MRLRKPCEHDLYDGHQQRDLRPGVIEYSWCPGGEFLPEDALVIEKVEGEWPGWAIDALSDATSNEVWVYADFLDALADQVGEPG